MRYRMRFRFADAEEAKAFGEVLFWVFAFTETDLVNKNIRKEGLSSIALISDQRHHFRYISVMAWEYDSFRGSDIIPEEANASYGGSSDT